MVITNSNRKINEFKILTDNTDWGKVLLNTFYICSNDKCKKLTLVLNLFTGEILEYRNGNKYIDMEDIIHEKTWNLIPESNAKVFPSYIPKALLDDYREACLIKDLSPKASATLSRRCLQWLIRDFWKVKEVNLYLEINALENIIDPLIFKAIDATRKIWNIWAHMEKDINLIIDVEPEEAEKLIYLIETLFKECYITKHEREQHLQAIVEISEDKQEKKRSQNTN